LTSLLRRTGALALLLLAGCVTPSGSDAPAGSSRDGAPSHTPANLASLPDPVPRREPKSRYGNPPSYVVFGKTYYVMERPDGYSEVGLASWYGTKFHGRPTSSGERYDMYKLTAAHRSLPIPTYVRVVNLDNEKSTIVRVNDRGPFHSDRIIDLSYAAAVKLGFANRGTTRVRIEALTGSPEPQVLVAERGASNRDAPQQAVTEPVLATAVPMLPPPQRAATDDDGAIYLQTGAYRSRAGAERVEAAMKRLVDAGVEIRRSAADALYRVMVGPVATLAEAGRLQERIARANYSAPLIVRE
jgi:rare lipoprotein A